MRYYGQRFRHSSLRRTKRKPHVQHRRFENSRGRNAGCHSRYTVSCFVRLRLYVQTASRKNARRIRSTALARKQSPLYVPADTELVTTLMSVYNQATNSNLDPIAIGGGTYSRCLPNCVAFGPLFPAKNKQSICRTNASI